MSFFGQLAARLGLSETSMASGYNLINYNGETIYIEGLIRLISVEDSMIKAELKGATIEVSGQDLKIAELSDCLIIKGTIFLTQFSEKKGAK